MPTLTAAQIAAVARRAGFPESTVPTAVAVALAESSGRTEAHNPIGADNSYGLWQINMLGSMGPARRRQFGISSNTALFNPAVNAKAAYAISSGGKNWRPWSTYTNGAYRLYLPSAKSGTSSARQANWLEDWWNEYGGGGLFDGDNWKEGWDLGSELGDSWNDFWGTPAPDELLTGEWKPGESGIFSIATAIAGAAEWMSDAHNWLRVGYVVLGGALVIGGLAMAARPALNAVPQVKALGKLTGK